MKIDLNTSVIIFVIGFVVSYACALILVNEVVFVSTAIIYLAAILAGINNKK